MKRIFHLGQSAEQVTDEVRRELDHHLELRTRELVAQGMTPVEARQAALASFGDRTAIEAEVREARRATVRHRERRDWWSELVQDLRVALRGLRRTPGFTIVALLTLTLGIGANSAMFSVVRSILLRPLPYPDAGRLVQVWSDYRENSGRTEPEWLSPPDFADWRDGNRSFEAMAAYGGWSPDLTGSGEPASLTGLAVSGDFFTVLGVAPAMGRPLLPPDDIAGVERTVTLSDGIWRRRFGGDPTILGRQIQLSGEPWTVVGVMPRTFRVPIQGPQPEVFRTFRRPATSNCGRGCIVLRAIGRLRSGVTLDQAQDDLTSIARRLGEQFPETNKGVRAWLVPLGEQLTGPTRAPLLTLAGAIGFVLLIACVNLAGLLLVRGEARGRELAVRAALGAGRGRLVRQLLVESALLAGAGGLLGLALAAAGSRVLATIVPPELRSIQAILVDGPVIGFTLGLTVLAGLCFGVAPAVKSAAEPLMATIRGGGRQGGGGMRRMLNGLVVAEVALAVTLLVGAGLLFQSFVRMQRVELGYRSSGVSLVSIAFPRARYADSTVGGVVDGLVTRLRASGAIRAAEVTDLPPLSNGDQDVTAIAVGEAPPEGAPGALWYRSVTPGYRQVMRYRLLGGRDLSPEDRAGVTRAGLLNQEAARRLFGSASPIGRVVQLGRDSSAPRVTIVGLVASARQDGPNQPYKPELFLPYAQSPARGITVVLEPARDAGAALEALKAALREVDPLLPLANVTSIEQLVRGATAAPRLSAALIGGFAVVALLLAMLGVYGVMAYVVAQRAREIGVRLALGAAPSGIRRLVLRQGGRLALAGIVIGLAAALALGQLLRSLLFQVSVFDPQTLVTVPLVLSGMALLACWIPARRAVRLDPLAAIRAE